ncbi:MAG: hypothetical protein CMJ84_12190 [Planctomycetes bacterium]|jgi:hypothetical protein|nr:hypothetical protein [Planctomycetota bacterium]
MVTTDPAVCALPQQPPVIHIQAPTAPEPAITDQIRSFMRASSFVSVRGRGSASCRQYTHFGRGAVLPGSARL